MPDLTQIQSIEQDENNANFISPNDINMPNSTQEKMKHERAKQLKDNKLLSRYNTMSNYKPKYLAHDLINALANKVETNLQTNKKILATSGKIVQCGTLHSYLFAQDHNTMNYDLNTKPHEIDPLVFEICRMEPFALRAVLSKEAYEKVLELKKFEDENFSEEQLEECIEEPSEMVQYLWFEDDEEKQEKYFDLRDNVLGYFCEYSVQVTGLRYG